MDDPITISIHARNESVDVRDLRAMILSLDCQTPESRVVISEESRPRFRSLDPTVLVALVSAGSTALGALITGVVALLRERRAGKISVGVGDTKIEISADTPVEKVRQIIDLIRENRGANVFVP
jgi:hypothetical protein